MNVIPLVKTNNINDINTSLIAIRKHLQFINSMVCSIDTSTAPDLIPFVKKTDVVDVVESGNNNPVTSNAVEESCLKVTTISGSTTDGGGYFELKKCGKLVTLQVWGMAIAQYAGTVTVTLLPDNYKPSRDIRVAGFSGSGSPDNNNMIGYTISSNGYVLTYPYVALINGYQQLYASWIVD